MTPPGADQRGQAAQSFIVKGLLNEIRCGNAEPFELRLQLFRPLEVGVLELPAELALVQVQQQFLRGRLVDPLGCGARVELGEKLNELTVGLAGLKEVLAGAAVQLGVEVIRRETGKDLPQVRVGGDPSERVALQPFACLEKLRRDLRRRAPGATPRTSKPWAAARSMPRSVAASPAASASKQR